jgi:hypothetical protein
LGEVVVKELVDNALDAAGDCELSISDSVVVIQDQGQGLIGDDDDIAHLFSISRPLTSTKYLRLPTRGALGNGLRVVVGAVLATGGKLFVSARGRRLKIIPDRASGESRAIPDGDYEGSGTRIELELGRPLELTPADLQLAEIAIIAAQSQSRKYKGNTSPHWYDTDSFHELLLSIKAEETTVRLIASFDGCSGKAPTIAGEFSSRSARSLSRAQASTLLSRMKRAARIVEPSRLGKIGKPAFSGAYAKVEGFTNMPCHADGSRISLPFVIEVWADPEPRCSQATFMINGTPCITNADAVYASKAKTTTVYGPRLKFDVKTGKTGIWLHINIMIPFIPMTSDGKDPSLGLLLDELKNAVTTAVRRARKLQPKNELRSNQREVVFADMEQQIVIVSDERRYRFAWRQVFYRLRPIVKHQIDVNLGWNYFSQKLVTEDEELYGEQRYAYRDPRGTFYHPHIGEDIPLGTLQVERYRRPEWAFGKILFIEKEGFFEALKAIRWPERHDCALMTSKGQPTRAARDLIDLIGETTEPVQVFCLHDADAAGTKIFQTLQEETRARPRRNVEIIDLGLNPVEARELVSEGLAWMPTKKKKPNRTAAASLGLSAEFA